MDSKLVSSTHEYKDEQYTLNYQTTSSGILVVFNIPTLILKYFVDNGILKRNIFKEVEDAQGYAEAEIDKYLSHPDRETMFQLWKDNQ